jgi:hypothetical protein
VDNSPIEPDAKPPSNEIPRQARPPSDSNQPASFTSEKKTPETDPLKQACDGLGAGSGGGDGEPRTASQSNPGGKLEAEKVEGPVTFGDVARDVIQNIFNIGSNASQPPPEDQKSGEARYLLDLAAEFTPRNSDLSWLETSEIDQYHRILINERIVFIVSPERQIARQSAWALVERMRLGDAQQRRLLDFERLIERSSIPHVLDLRKPDQNQNGANGRQEVALVIDGVSTNDTAKEFLNSFPIDTRDDIVYGLEQSHVYMLYLVDAADLETRLRNVFQDQQYGGYLQFPRWKLPFLRSILKPHFADNYLELETKIRQRADWPQGDDRQLFTKVNDLIKKGLLEQSLDDQAAAPDCQTSATIFTGNDPIQDTVAYVGAFFKGLNPREFQRIIPLLLGEKTRTITVPGSKQNEDGTSQKIELQKEKPLVLIWQESMDQINRQCSLITVPAPDGTRTVDFNDQRIKAQLRQYIEDEHGFFVSSQFSQLFDIGLLFDPSVRIGESMVSLTAAMVASDPEYYLQQLVNMIEQLEAGPDAMAARFPPFTIMAGLDPSQADNHIYQRIADLIRALLADPRRKGIVASLMEQLMRRKMFGPVLKIVRKLRSVSGFDEAHWLKQLFERGDSLIGDVTLFYLYGYFKSLGPRVYQLLTSLDAWIPNEPLNETPPASAREALRLLLVHCFEATARLDGKYYGASPSRHPLFAFRDRDLAESNLDLLVRWLLHPWMQSVFSDESEFKSVECLVAALTFQWTQILIGQSGSLSSKQKADATFSSNEVQQILVNQLVTRADINQQRLMVSEWQKQSRRMLHQIERAPYASEKRNDLIWRRNLLNDLITQFRNLASAKASTRTAT